MEKQGKLELTWVGKYEEERLEPRILIEDQKNQTEKIRKTCSYMETIFLALRALENDFSGKISVYI